MEQQQLIPVDLDQSLDDLVRALDGYKSVAYALWPTKSPATAYSRIKACLDPSQENTNFSPAELLWLLQRGRRVGFHGLANYLMKESCYAVPQPVAQISRKQELLDMDADLASKRAAVARELSEIDQAEVLAKASAA